MSGKRIGGSCPYNEGIDCDKKICDKGGKCGWFPMVERLRKSKLKNGEIPSAENAKTKNPKYDRDFSEERKKRLIAEGKCPVCGGENDRLPGGYCCSTCRERAKVLQKARETIFP